MTTLALAACSAGSDSAPEGEREGTTSQAVLGGAGAQAVYAVTPYDDPDPDTGMPGHWTSETATLVNASNGYRDIVAYNAEDPDHMFYTSTTRKVYPGTAAVGWSWANHPASQNGFSPVQRIAPPPGWGALWGDPGLGQVPNSPYVYLTTVAVPMRHWPCARGPAGDPGGCSLYKPIEGSMEAGDPLYPGGACIARSTDGGISFQVSADDCVHTDSYDFYDGTDTAGAGNGVVLAAFHNVPTGAIDVWRAPGATAPFSQVANPFPGKSANIHPRLVTGRDDNSFIYIVASVGGTSEIWLNRYDTVNDTWGQAPDWPMRVATDYDNPDDRLPEHIRPAAGYDVMVNFIPHHGTHARVVYTASSGDGMHTVLRAADCPMNAPSSGCWPLANATIDPGMSAFNPAVAAADVGYSSYWKVTWEQRDSSNGTRLALFSASLTSSGALWNAKQETAYETPCPRGDHYWGDYDVHLGVFEGSSGAPASFLRSFSDSTDPNGFSQCFFQWTWKSTPVHVSQLMDSF